MAEQIGYISGYIVLGLFLGGAGAWLISRYGSYLGVVDVPNSRSSHTRPTPRGGGVGLLLTFMVVSLTVAGIPLSLWLPAAFLGLVSFFDDRLDLRPGTRLFFQFGAATIVVLGAVFSQFSFLSLALIPFWLVFIVGTANFYNFMDGINGIAGITGVVGFGLITVFVRMMDAGSALFFVSLALSAACVGFLPFNLPKAKVFMGDGGSILLGFVFAAMTFILADNLPKFLCFLACMFPFYADALTTLLVRWRDGEKLSQAHRRHLYQILANELTTPHWLVACGYGLVQSLAGILMFWAWPHGLCLQLLLTALLSMSFLFFSYWIRKKFA